MDPLAPAVVRAAGTIAGAALGRYRPVGVVRVGSAEDRAQSYRRFLDAVVHASDAQILYYYRRRDAEAVRGIRPRLRLRRIHLREVAWRQYTQAQIEVHAALLGIRLCAPAPVLTAAEDLVASIPRFYRPGTRHTLPEQEYLTAHDQCTAAQAVFLEAARRDLDYHPRPWQLLRKRRERKYREQASRR
ncbi:hypothetical protein ACTVZO_41710 [Streptomyces sp. IBSNAI002]|uniref:hypothetical protein n=1 Tax=Streptomyces sp. IBSNAI002 TaxID=3457500 RepID=UPI003FCF7971